MRFEIHHYHHVGDDVSAIKHLLHTLQVKLEKVFVQGEKIMSAISDFADKMQVHNASVDAAVDGLTSDVKNLSDQIAALQASQGQITPADQALLDGIEAKAKVVTDKLAALDALTPPVAP